MRSPKRRRRRGDPRVVARYLPLGALALALVVASLALPTSLRPPQQPPNNSAELSPDAPPDDTQEALISALNRGISGTAGEGPGETGAAPQAPGAETSAPPSAPALAPPSFCPGGFGDPPRQVESLYAAPCAAGWQGDNGGATWKGVTSTEVRIGIVQSVTHDGGMGLANGEGPLISETPPENESAAHRTWRVYQSYFNQNFQLWGRQLRFVVMPNSNGDAFGGQDLRSKVQALDEEHHVFAVHTNDVPGLTEAARRQLVGFGGLGWREAVYHDNQPYLSSWTATGSSMMRRGAEYLCAKLADRQAVFAGETEQAKVRKFGVLTAHYNGLSGAGAGTEFARLVKDECGIDVVTVVWSEGNSFDPSSVATGVARLRAEGVTTVVTDIDVVFLSSYLSNADGQGYFPEYFVLGTWFLDETTSFHQGFSKTQWSHAFGLSPKIMAQRVIDRDHYRAYQSIDPAAAPADNGPHAGVESHTLVFPQLLQIANGIQLAGPGLTPESFRRGLESMGKRANVPAWTVGGGYGPGDYSYADDVAEIWWDTTARSPAADNTSGAWRYVDCGRRFGSGALPPGEARLFDPAGSCTIAPGPG